MTLTNAEITQILEKANWYPSGDNCQPWSYDWDGKTLELKFDTVRAKHPLDISQISSLLALGCLVEGINLAASEFGSTVSYTVSDPSENEGKIFSKLSFSSPSKDIKKNDLAEVLVQRTTDRRKFDGGELSSRTLANSINQEELFSPARAHTVSKISNELFNYILDTEDHFVSEPKILQATLKWVRFTKNDALKTRDGLPWRNLGVHFWELPLLPFIRDYLFLGKILKNFLRIQRRKEVKGQLDSSAGLVCVSVSKGDSYGIVQAGRLMMRCWLALNKQGYGVHPLTLPSIYAFAAHKNNPEVPATRRDFYRKGSDLLSKEFLIPEGAIPLWMVRTGISSPLPKKMRTLRRRLGDVFRQRQQEKIYGSLTTNDY